MAIDHWLLEQHKLGLLPPTLRFYTWSPPAISLGYHQSNWPEYWQQLTARRTLAVSTTSYGWTGSAAPGLTYAVVTSGLCGSRVQVYQAL